MTTLVRTELLKLLLTRSTWGFLATALLLGMARVEIVLRNVGKVGSPEAGSLELAVSVLGSSAAGMIMVLLLGVVTVTGEFQHSTFTGTLLTTPARRRVVVAKMLASALVGAATSVSLFSVAALRGLVAGDVVLTAHPALLQLVAGGVVASALWGWLGAALGLLVRSQTLSVVLPVTWFVVIETLLPSFGLSWLMPWTPGGATSGLTGADFAGVLPVWTAALVLVLYGLVLTTPAVHRLVHADIT